MRRQARRALDGRQVARLPVARQGIVEEVGEARATAAASPGVQVARRPPAQSGAVGSRRQSASLSLAGHVAGAGRRVGAGSGDAGRGRSRQARQNGVKTLNGSPARVFTSQGSNSRLALRLSATTPRWVEATASAAHRARASPGRRRGSSRPLRRSHSRRQLGDDLLGRAAPQDQPRAQGAQRRVERVQAVMQPPARGGARRAARPRSPRPAHRPAARRGPTRGPRSAPDCRPGGGRCETRRWKPTCRRHTIRRTSRDG